MVVRNEGENCVSFSLNNGLGGFSRVTLLVFLGGFSLLEGVGLLSPCLKVLNNFKADVFEVDPLLVILPMLSRGLY